MRVKDPETSQNRTLAMSSANYGSRLRKMPRVLSALKVRQDTGAYRAFDDEDVDTLLNSVTDDVSKSAPLVRTSTIEACAGKCQVSRWSLHDRATWASSRGPGHLNLVASGPAGYVGYVSLAFAAVMLEV